MILLDSDHVSVLSDLRDRLHGPFAERLTLVSEPIAIPVVVLEEHFRGWLAQQRRSNDPQLAVSSQRLPIAISQDALLLSANLNDFQLVPGLNVEDWLLSLPDENGISSN